VGYWVLFFFFSFSFFSCASLSLIFLTLRLSLQIRSKRARIRYILTHPVTQSYVSPAGDQIFICILLSILFHQPDLIQTKVMFFCWLGLQMRFLDTRLVSQTLDLHPLAMNKLFNTKILALFASSPAPSLHI
jgi:hypothetical protein